MKTNLCFLNDSRLGVEWCDATPICYDSCETQGNERQLYALTNQEVIDAETFLLKLSQREAFQLEIVSLRKNRGINRKSSIVRLNPFLDHLGLIRVGGRLRNADIHSDTRHPIILPAKHQVTNLIATEVHTTNWHVGPQGLLAIIRQKCWPIHGKTLVKQFVRQCVKCFRAKPIVTYPMMGQLPNSRVKLVRAFLNTGLDFCGPFLLRQSRNRKAAIVKSYIAVFVCMATHAMHLELVSDLTAESFIAALKRFMARRGKCATISCGNGTNFTGARRILTECHKLVIKNSTQDALIRAVYPHVINWHFISPSSPHFGGIWEASVRSVKFHLTRVMGEATLVFEELYTLLTLIEACLNSRPLIPMSDNPTDLSILTPTHFLIEDSLLLPLEEDVTTTPVSRLKRWELVQSMHQHFWKRWSTEYLVEMQRRTKWHQQTPPLNIGYLVLVRDDNLPPLLWRLGRVIDVHPGPDNVVRVATVKTMTNVLKRPVVKLCRLPVDQ